MDNGFHCTPLVPGCLKVLQYVSPCAVGAAQCHLSNKVNSLGCAAQYNRRARADTQLRIDWKVRHAHLTPSRGTGSISETKVAQQLPCSIRHYREAAAPIWMSFAPPRGGESAQDFLARSHRIRDLCCRTIWNQSWAVCQGLAVRSVITPTSI
jgi:hypothetical protein